MTHQATVSEIVSRSARAAFGRPLVTNVLRGLVVEAMVAIALEPEWRWCAADYSAWDFERGDGLRLEVKQSALRQSWAVPSDPPSNCSFDIAPRKGRWEGAAWIDAPGRAANLYVFSHHGEAGVEADHRDPSQWTFYVVSAARLPNTKRLSLARLKALADPIDFADLAGFVQRLAGAPTCERDQEM